MSLHRTRRATLALGGATLTLGLPGCAGLGGSSDPDQGTDSYGLLVRNQLDDPYDVAVVVQPIGGDPVFEETVTATPDEEQSWDEVLTEPGLTQVKADMLDVERHFDDRLKTASNYIDVGGENAPEATDVVVEVYPQEIAEFPESPVVAVQVIVPGPGP